MYFYMVSILSISCYNLIFIKTEVYHHMESCTSCNKEVREEYTQFKCPACGKSKIIRCNRCKSISKLYKCPECGFIGP